jgi:murein DD-endopeptidase MepM/ murein hydrolase activator NlpD
VAGLARLASPVGIVTRPEQRMIDQTKGQLQESGNAPMRTPGEGLSDDIFNEGKYGASNTVEGRRLNEIKNGYDALVPQSLREASYIASDITGAKLEDGSITLADGTTYTNEDLAAMSYDDRKTVKAAYLAEQGYTQDDLTKMYAAQDAYLAEHPDLAAYKAYTKLVDQAGGPQAFTEQMAAVNPAFAQYLQSQMTDHTTGEIDYTKVFNPDAYLTVQGVRPSVYSPIVGNEPSTAPGGYPAIPGVEPGQPVLNSYGIVNTSVDTPIFAKPSDVDQTYYDDPHIAIADPRYPLQALSAPETYTSSKGVATQMVKVDGGTDPTTGKRIVGYVDLTLLANVSPAKPIGSGTVQQPSGGLAAAGGQLLNAAGAAKDALLGGLSAIPEAIGDAIPAPPPPAPAPQAPAAPASGNPLDAVGAGIGAVLDAAGGVASSLTGHNDGTPQKPTTTAAPGITPGKVVVIPAPDGMGIATDPVPTDQTWLEDMIGKGHATVTVQYKGGHPGPETPDPSKPTGVSTWYDYQLGHGADNLHHAAIDVSCDTGDCEGTPIYAPADGTIGCAGYGVGDSGNPAATCGYSTYTTTNNHDGSAPAHDVTLTMGTDPQGNQLILEMAHIGTADLTPGQQVRKGDLIATMGNGDCPEGPCPHTHVEAWGYSPELGAFRMIDPNLLINGYYATHGVDDGISPGT